MLSDKNVAAVVAVKDMEVAKEFYEGKLGLKAIKSDPGGGNIYKCADSVLLVYPSQYAGTNKATAAGWEAGDDLEIVVDELKSKGVEFEHYDMPGATRDGDIHVMGQFKAVWFKDPDGNILNLTSGM